MNRSSFIHVKEINDKKVFKTFKEYLIYILVKKIKYSTNIIF